MTSTERSRACRARQKATQAERQSLAELGQVNPVAPVAATDATVRTIVEQFTRLNSELRSKLAEVASTSQATAIGQQVLSDPDLLYLVEKLWFKSATQRERLKAQVSAYRRGLMK